MLTPDAIKKAFQDSIPARRDAFAREVRACHHRLTHGDDQYPIRYPREVLSLAENEMRARNELAADRIKALLESGWTPPESTSIRGVYTNMFTGIDDWRKDASSDLYERVGAAFGEVGRSDPPQEAAHKLRLGEIQVQSAEACISDLECYQVKKPQPPSITVSNTGTVGALQVGQSNVAHVTQSVSSEVKMISDALKVVREQLPTLQDDGRRQEIESYVAAIDAEIEKPAPRSGYLKTWLENIGRAVAPIVEWTGKSTVEAIVGAAIRAITHS